MGSTLRGRALTWKARGISDAKDATNAPPGAMEKLSNLIPDPSTRNLFVPRPAALALTSFGGFTSPAQVNALLTVGNIAYGVIAETGGAFSGLDVPFAYNFKTNTFNAISIPRGATALPATPAASGDWTPPIMEVVGSRILLCHPGFAGGSGSFFGWLDISGFSDTTHTGNTHSNTTIDGLSANVLQAGWQVGMTIAGAGIPANTTILAIASNGLSLTLSQAATATANTVALTVAGGTVAAPLYDSGNTNGNPLASVPVAVQQFNGRAYFGVGAGLTWSDAGSPCQATNATQALLFRNGLNVTAMGGIGLFSTTVGGIVQSLMVFQGDAQIWQIQGDTTFAGGLTANALNSGVGTIAPLSVCETTAGLAFISGDGLRILELNGTISDPISIDGAGVVVPFLYALNPTRIAAAFNQGVLRISLKNGADPNQAIQEYWFDLVRKIWTGPHTFPAALIAPMQLAGTNSFILAGSGINAQLWQSDVTPSINATYTENGTALQWMWATCLLPDNAEMSENAVIETATALQLPAGSSVQVVAYNELGTVLSQAQINGPAGTPPLWDTAQWDSALWDGAAAQFRQYPVPWTEPLVFKQMQVQINGNSMLGESIGNLYLRYEELNYQMQSAGAFV